MYLEALLLQASTRTVKTSVYCPLSTNSGTNCLAVHILSTFQRMHPSRIQHAQLSAIMDPCRRGALCVHLLNSKGLESNTGLVAIVHSMSD
jgi:hypothetical protein